ncbi:hypothetical protein FLWE109334_13995 [Flavobacterium weaverense]
MLVIPELETPIGLKGVPVNIAVPPVGSVYHLIFELLEHPVATKLPDPPTHIEAPVVVGAPATPLIIMLSVGKELHKFKLAVVIE